MNPQHFWSVGMQNNRAEYEYIHDTRIGISTAFEIKEKAEICLKIPRSLGAARVYMDVFDENAAKWLLTLEAEWCGIDGEYDRYIFDITKESFGVGLYFIRPRLLVLDGELFGHNWEGAVYFDRKGELTNMMQLTIFNRKYPRSSKLRGGVIYHIFVDRFRRGGVVDVPDGARIVRGQWKVVAEYPEYPGAHLYNNTFWGGTLWGIIEKLDYIKSLGTTAIYLSPIFRAASNHKYDTADYMSVDPIFGGEEALRALLSAAAEKGIEIILDGVFNHTGADSIYFNRYGRYKEIGAYQSRRSKYFGWFDFQQFPNKYTSWWGIDILPRINTDIPDCREYFVGEGGVVDKYRKMGVYGFRLDVADELSDGFISDIKKRLSSDGGENILYGEVWEDASNKSSYGKRRRYYLGDELDGVMNYPLRAGIVDYLIGKGKDKLFYALNDVTSNAPSYILHNQMNLLGTHDTERILTVLGDVDVSGLSNAVLAKLRMDPGRRSFAIKRLILAYTILATMPGIPTVFYGDEAGLEGYRDPFNRMPFPWGAENHKLLEHYKRIGRVRSENPVYKDGDFRLVHLDDELFVFLRTDNSFNYVTVVNNSDREIKITFDSKAVCLLSSLDADRFSLSALEAGVYKLPLNTNLEVN